MKPELVGAFRREFPALYSRLDTIWCGDGWALLLRRLSVTLEPFAARTGACATQVKEKWGTLRIGLRLRERLPEDVHAALMAAYEASVRTCEECGAPGTTYSGLGRYCGRVQTLCPSCLEQDRGRTQAWRAARGLGDRPIGLFYIRTEPVKPTPTPNKLRVWLDDVRPAPAGWTWALTADAAIAHLETGKVVAISLDHDLGDDDAFGTGYDVLLWLEEQVALCGFEPPETITIHSANIVGRRRMEQAIESIARLVASRREADKPMKREDFRIGGVFYTGAGAWVCTDVGTRVIVAVEERYLKQRPAGPPYEWAESVFDEYDQAGCSASPDEAAVQSAATSLPEGGPGSNLASAEGHAIVCVPACIWHGVTWSDVASLDDPQAERYILERAGGPWCRHHFGRHRWARTRQLTGRLALLAMTLDDDERRMLAPETVDSLLHGLHRDIADAARCAVDGIAARDFDRLGYPSGIQLSPAERAALVELVMSPYSVEALRKIIADACSRPVFYLLVQLDGHADDWAGADLVERSGDEPKGDLAEQFFAMDPPTT